MTSEQAIELLCKLTGEHPENVREPGILEGRFAFWLGSLFDLRVDDTGRVRLAGRDGGMYLTGPVGAALARAFLAATNPKAQEV